MYKFFRNLYLNKDNFIKIFLIISFNFSVNLRLNRVSYYYYFIFFNRELILRFKLLKSLKKL